MNAKKQAIKIAQQTARELSQEFKEIPKDALRQASGKEKVPSKKKGLFKKKEERKNKSLAEKAVSDLWSELLGKKDESLTKGGNDVPKDAKGVKSDRLEQEIERYRKKREEKWRQIQAQREKEEEEKRQIEEEKQKQVVMPTSPQKGTKRQGPGKKSKTGEQLRVRN